MVMRWNIIVKDSKLITESNGERTERKFEKVEAGAYRHITVNVNILTYFIVSLNLKNQ